MSATKRSRESVQPDILRAAIHLFGVHSFRGVTTRALAKEARVHPPLVYAWFTSKKNLYTKAIEAVVSEINAEFGKFMVELFAGAGGTVNVDSIGPALRKWYESIPHPSARLLLQVLISDDARSHLVRQPLQQMINAIANVLSQKAKSKTELNPHVSAQTLVRALLWGKVTEDEDQAKEIVQQWLLGLPRGAR